MNWPMIIRLPSLLFGAAGTPADAPAWDGDTAGEGLRFDMRRSVAVVDDDAVFLKKLGRRSRASTIRFKTAAPLLLKARHSASLTGTAPWSAIVIAAGLADMNGITAMARIKTLFPHLPIWLALPLEEPHSMLAAICAGADGYLIKRADADSLRLAIAGLPSGEPPMSGRLALHLYELLTRPRNAGSATQAHYGFSTDQVRFIRMTAERGSSSEAARAMGLDTARRGDMMRSIYRQLRNRITSAAVLADMRLNHLAIH